jgi:hypothetical protein
MDTRPYGLNIQIGHFPSLKRRIDKWKDERRKEIVREEQVRFLRRCLEERVTPKGLLVQKKGIECRTVRWRNLIRKLQKELVWDVIRKKREELCILREMNEKVKSRFEEQLSVFTRELTMEELQCWEQSFREKQRQRLDDKGRRLGWKNEESKGIKKKVVVIGETSITKDEENFLSLGRKFKVTKQKADIEELVYGVEEALQQMEDKERLKEVRNQVVKLVKNVPRRNKCNLRENEIKGLRSLKYRKDIVIEQADKGGAVVVMEKEWYKEKLKNLNDDTYEDVSEVGEEEEENIKKQIMEEGKKKGFSKLLDEQGKLPRMKGFPKIHKEEVKLRPVLDCRGNIMELLEKKIKRIAESLKEEQESRSVVNSTEVKKLLENLGTIKERTLMFSVDVKSMFPSMKREEILKIIDKLMKDKRIEKWNKERMKKAVSFIWDNSYCKISDKIVKMKDGLSIGSCISPVMADLVMNEWEKLVIEKGKDKLLAFCRYVDDCFGVWKGTREQLEGFINDIDDEERGIKLEKEIEKNGVLNFLDLSIVRKEKGSFVTSWYQKECAAGIYCHKRSEVDDGTKMNFIKNMEEKIKIITMEEDQKEKDLDKLWEQLRGNGYEDRDKHKIRKRKKKDTKNEEEQKEEQRRWYGIESAGEISNKIRRILRREGIKTYKKGGEKILDIVRNKKKKSKDAKQKGVIYQVPCEECDRVYIGETKKRLKDRLRQHKDDVRLKRDTNAIYKHVMESDHEINWEGATVIEQESRMLVRKWKEARRIREVEEKAMNWNNGLNVNEEWEGILLKEEKRKSRYANRIY